MRLFVGEPVWTPHNREEKSTDEMIQRLNYLIKVKSKKTSYGRKDILIENPTQFDSVVNSLEKGTNTILYFTASDDPETGLPWCSDVRKAQPLVEQVLLELSGKFYFVKCPVLKSEYVNNRDHFYRNHTGILLKKIPTMAMWEGGIIHKLLIETELHNIDNIRLFLLNNNQ